ncbi:MAG: glycosyltransferase [Firmicutes bacterium]|nr:glycosyltransferase [Bacillota bacterium]
MLDIVIPMYNAMEYSQRCVNSIRSTLSGVPYKIHILNNGSTDGTGEWLASLDGPDIDIQTSPVNVGAPKGKNIILSHMEPSDFVLFIDNDIEFKETWYEPFFAFFQQHEEAGVVGIEGYNLVVHADHRDVHLVSGDSPQQCDILRGCFMMVRGSLVQKLAPFDENCGMYWHDDDDFCIRAMAEGYRNYWLATDKVFHYGSRSSATTYPDVRSPEESARVQRYLVQKWRDMGLIGPDGRPKVGGSQEG